MKNILFELITDWKWQNPINESEMRKRFLVIIPLALLSYFFFPLVFVLLPFVVMSYHRRLIDILGVHFYQGQRLAMVWIGLIVMGTIPILGPVLIVWIIGWWNRNGVRDGLNQFFERVELI